MHQHVLRLRGKRGTIIKRSQVHWKGIFPPRRGVGGSDSPYSRRQGPTTLAVTARHVDDFAATGGATTTLWYKLRTLVETHLSLSLSLSSTNSINDRHLTISDSSTNSSNSRHQHQVEARNHKRDKRNGTFDSNFLCCDPSHSIYRPGPAASPSHPPYCRAPGFLTAANSPVLFSPSPPSSRHHHSATRITSSHSSPSVRVIIPG